MNNNNDPSSSSTSSQQKPAQQQGRARRMGHYAINQPIQIYDKMKIQPKQRRHTHHAAPPQLLVNNGQPAEDGADMRKRILIHQTSLNEKGKPSLEGIEEEGGAGKGSSQRNENPQLRTRSYSTPDTVARDDALKKYYIERYMEKNRQKKKSVTQVKVMSKCVC